MNESQSKSSGLTASRAPALDHPRAMPLWRNVNFELMWSSIAASGFGDRLVQLSAWMILGIAAANANAASIQAGVTFFFFLPYLVFAPLGGIIADRLPRKWIMFTCDESRALVLLSACGLIWYLAPDYNGQVITPDYAHYNLAIYSTYGIVFLTGVFAAVFGPTRDAMTPQIVPMKQLQAANAIILAIASIAAMIGLAVGGLIIERFSVAAAIFIAAGCYLITGSFWAFVKPVKHVSILPQAEKKKRSHGFGPALRYIANHKRIIILFMIALLFWALASVFLAVLAAVCKSEAYFNIPPDKIAGKLGILQASVGVGMLVSSITLMIVRDLRHAPKLILGGLLLSGVLLGVFWLNPYYGFGLALAGGIGFFSNFARVGADTLTQAISADYIRGRIFGLREILTTGAAVIVNLIIWQLPDADSSMITLLPYISLILIGMGAVGMWHVRHTGPKPKLSVQTTESSLPESVA